MKFSGVITNDQRKVQPKGQGQRSKVKVTEVTTQLNRFRTVTPVWIHIWWWNDAYSLMLLRRGALFRVPTGPYFREKCLVWNMGVPAQEKSLLLNIFDRSPGKVLIFNRCVKTWMINIALRKLRFFQVLWQWRRTFRESQRPVNQSPLASGMTPSGSRQNTTCFIHKILLRSNWEPIGRHMMSRGSCTQFDWSTVSSVHMAHASQNIEHIRGNTATYVLRLNSTNEWSVCT